MRGLGRRGGAASAAVLALALALALPSAGSGWATAGEEPAAQPPTSVIYVGDSLTARSSRLDGGLSAQGHATWTQILTGERLWLIRNAGRAGDGVEAIWTRLQADVLAHDPDVVVYLAGINDIKRIPGWTAARISQVITRTLDALEAAGIWTIILTLAPSDHVDTASEKAELAELNTWIRSLATARSRLSVVDIYPLVASSPDPLAPGPLTWAEGLSDDGTHPNAAGARRMGEAVAAAVNQLRPPGLSVPGRGSSPVELMANPTLDGDRSGKADHVVTYTYSGEVPIFRKVARPDVGTGAEWQEASVSGPSSHRIQQNVTRGFSAGDKVVATIEIEEDPGAYVDLHATALEAWSPVFILGSMTLMALGAERVEAGVIRLPAYTVPLGTASLRLYHRVSTGEGGATWRIGRMSLVKVP